MSQKSLNPKPSSERLVKDIRRATRKHYSAEDKIRIALDGLRGEQSIAELCRREAIAESLKNLTPADVYFGKAQTILLKREKIKRQTIQNRRLLHSKKAA